VVEPAAAGTGKARFGRFVIRGVLGQGAYGRVYRASDPDLGRDVALKILKRDVSDPQVLRQLRQEARALGQLRHRNILRVFEDGLHGNEYFIVSRLVDARPLSVVLAEERVAPRQAAGWIRDVAEALAYAHREGLLHRDIKPANILITARSEALLADFGLALDIEELNQARALYGTPAYMAPEQIRGDPKQVGPHTDQYSLAVVLHELLTGRLPSRPSVPAQPESQPPAMPSEVDRRLEAICLKALSQSPADRYPNLDAMADDLDHWLSGKKIKAKPRRVPVAERARRHAAFLVAAAVALALGVLLVTHWRWAARAIARRDRDRLQLIDKLDQTKAEQERNSRELDQKLADQAAAFERERASFRRPLSRLHLEQAERSEAAGELLDACIYLASAIDLGIQSWNENEKQRARDELAALSARLIPAAEPSQWPRSGGPVPRVLVPELTEWLGIERDHPTRQWPARRRDWHQAAYDPDLAQAVSPGGEYAFLFPASIWRAADGSLVDAAAGNPAVCSAAAFRSDGRTLLVAYGNRTLRFWDPSTGKPSGDLVPHPQLVTAAAIAPDGRSALAAGQDRVIRRIDPATGRVIGELLRHPAVVKHVRYERDGREFTTVGHDGIVRRWDAETGTPRGVAVVHDLSVTTIASSSDSRSLLKVSEGSLPEWRFGQLWDRDGHALGLPFPMFSVSEASLDIDPDAEAILAATIRGPLLARLALGLHVTGSVPDRDAPVRFSRDGKTALTVGTDGSLRLWDVASLKPRGPAFQASRSIMALSPDGQLAATRGPGDAVKLWSTTQGKLVAALDTRDAPVRHLSLSPDGTVAISWSDSAKQFITPAQFDVRRWDVATGRSIDPPLSHNSGIRWAEFSPGGSTVLTLGDQDDAKLWNASTGRLIGSWPLKPDGSVQAAAFHPDGKTLATGGAGGTLSRWSTSTGLAVGLPLSVGSAIRLIAYAAKGQVLMTISTDSTSLWDAETGRRLATLLRANGQPLFTGSAGYGAALSPDGMRVLTRESFTGQTRLWDAATGRPLGPSCAIAGSPVLSSDDGSIVVMMATNGPQVWDLSAGVQRGAFYPFGDALEVASRSHDGRKVLAALPAGPDPRGGEIPHRGKRAGRYQLRDATSARPAGDPFTLDETVAALALGPDGRIVSAEWIAQAGGSEPRPWSRLHDAVTGKPLSQRLPRWTTGWSPDGQIVLVGSTAWHVPVTNVNDLRLRSDRPVRQVAFEPDGRTVVTIAGPADLSRWDLATGRIVYRLPDRAGRSVLSLSADGRLALVAEGNVARLLRVESGRELEPPLEHAKPATLASFSPDGKMVVSSEGTAFQVWDTSTARRLGSPRPCHGVVVTLAMGPAGAVYVEESPAEGTDWGHRHVVWKEETAGRRIGVPETGVGGVARFSPDGRYLYIGGPRTGRLWDVSEDPPRARPDPLASEASGKGIRAAAFLGDGRLYSVAYQDGMTEVRDVATNRRIGPPRKADQTALTPALPELFRHLLGIPLLLCPYDTTPTALSFSPDGRTLLIGSHDGLARLWAVPLAVPEQRVSRWLERRTGVQLSPDLTLKALDREELLDRWTESGESR
jgi:WD40 repeat protein